MTIEHMAENASGVTGEPGPTTATVTVPLPETKPTGILNRWWRRDTQQPQPVPAAQATANPETSAQLPTQTETGPPNQEPPDGGDGRGNGGGNNRRPEGVQPPEGRKWTVEDIWSSEFITDGIRITTEMIDLRAKRYEERYQTGKFKELVQEWKGWCALRRRRSDVRESFKPFQMPEFKPPSPATESTQATKKESTQIDDLGDITKSAQDLFEYYNVLRQNPEGRSEVIITVEGQLSRCFKEARRMGFLVSADSNLRSIYVSIMKGLSKQPPDLDSIWDKIFEGEERIKKSGQTTLRGTRRSNPQLRGKLVKLEGVWDIYAELAIDRFSELLKGAGSEETPKGSGLVGTPIIDGEFIFKIGDMAFSAETRADLKQLVQTDAELRNLAQNDDALWRLVKGDRVVFERLENNREEAYSLLVAERDRKFRQLVEEREEGIRNLPRDREAYRAMAEERELFWIPTYANYYEVFARTPGQFQTAVDTFTQWIRSGLTKSPGELFQRVNGFIDALTTAGQRERANVSDNFMIGLRQELQGMIAVLGADWANEHYNAENFQRFLEFGAQDEGPARFIRLGKVAKGKVASVLHKLDKNPRFEMLFALYGSRGEFMRKRNAIEQDRLVEHILDILIAETAGVEIKSYDPRDADKRTKAEYDQMARILEANLNRIKESRSVSPDEIEKLEQTLEAVRKINPFTDNLDELVKFSSEADEVFRNLFDGFDQKDQDGIYAQLSHKQAQINWARQMQQRFSQSNVAVEDIQLYLGPEGYQLYEQFIRGQLVLKPAEQITLTRLQRARKIQKNFREGKGLSGLSAAERAMYEEARNAVTLAWEIYGVMGEKGERAGEAFIVDRQVDGRSFKDYISKNEAEDFVMFAENWTKATYGHLPAPQLTLRVTQARKMALWALKRDGFEAQLFDFTLMKDGEIVDLETFLGVDNFKQPLHPNILGFDKNGYPVTLTFGKDGKAVIKATNKDGNLVDVEPDSQNRPILYDRGREKVWVWDKNAKKGEYADRIGNNRQPLYFDNLKIDTLAREKMLLKTPIPKREDDKIVFEKREGKEKPVIERVDSVEVKFETAIHHIYARSTRHMYWGYQEQDTGLILTHEAFAGAQRIKDGLSRPEDAEPHATQLLIVDPTLERVRHFEFREGREDKVVRDAVEESYQSSERIGVQLHETFYPADADDEFNRIVMGLQDFGGSTKMWYAHRAYAARWTDMELRRLRTHLPKLRIGFRSMPRTWGAGSALGVLRMMNYAEYRMVGQFALEKWIAQTGAAQDVFEALYGYANPNEKRDMEGFGKKPINDADRLSKLRKHLQVLDSRSQPDSKMEEEDHLFLNEVRESLGRFEKYLQRVHVLETGKRGERAPQWLEGVDIWKRDPDGSIKEETYIDEDGNQVPERVFNRDIDQNANVGSAYHSSSVIFWAFVSWLRSEKHGEGQSLYSDVARFYEIMDQSTIASQRRVEEERPGAKLETRWEWLHGKLNQP